MATHRKTAAQPLVRYVGEAPTVPCLCGESTRVLTRTDTPVANVHVTHIMDSQKHYHEHCSEIYYILEGSGFLELDDKEVPLRPGLLVFIPPGVTHRGRGDFRTLIVGVPAQDPKDEVVVE